MSSNDKITVWLVGGEDVRLRIPIIISLINKGFNVSAVGTESPDLFEKYGIEYHRYSLKRGVAPISDKKSLKELVKLFSKGQPDIVHAFDTKPAILVPKAAMLARVKGSVRTITGMGYIFSSRSLMALAFRIVYCFMQRQASLRSDITIFQNEDDKLFFESSKLVYRSKSKLVRGSGIDLNLLENSVLKSEECIRYRNELNLKGKVVITMVARLVKYKGVVNFLEAARIVKDKFPNCEFLLIGPVHSEGRQAVSQTLLDSYKGIVTWLGQREDVQKILRISHIFVLPTYYPEGTPRSLLESASIGRPIITTNTPGCRNVIIENQSGFFCKINDYWSCTSCSRRKQNW